MFGKSIMFGKYILFVCFTLIILTRRTRTSIVLRFKKWWQFILVSHSGIAPNRLSLTGFQYDWIHSRALWLADVPRGGSNSSSLYGHEGSLFDWSIRFSFWETEMYTVFSHRHTPSLSSYCHCIQAGCQRQLHAFTHLAHSSQLF